MAYTPNTWVTGDTITADKLNNMEQGIASAGAFIVNNVGETLNKTWQEIYDAAEAGLVIILYKTIATGISLDPISIVSFDNNQYIVETVTGEQYATTASSEYPGLPK